MPSAAELKSEITGDPESLGYATPWAAGSDAGVLALLASPTRPGYVPARWVSVSLAKYPTFDATLAWSMRTGQLPDGTALTGAAFGIFALFQNLARLDKSNTTGEPLRAAVADVQAGLAAAGNAGIVGDSGQPIPSAFGPYLLSGEVKISRVQELWGLDASVSLDDVTTARAA